MNADDSDDDDGDDDGDDDIADDDGIGDYDDDDEDFLKVTLKKSRAIFKQFGENTPVFVEQNSVILQIIKTLQQLFGAQERFAFTGKKSCPSRSWKFTTSNKFP